MLNEFTCHDGTCINVEDRCNGILECTDGTDEDNCHILSFNEGSYKQEYPPIIEAESGSQPLQINVSIWIFAIEQVMEIDMRFKTKFSLSMEWKDNRLTYYNLKNGFNSNLIAMKDRSNLWIPPIVFNNTEDNQEVSNGEHSLMFVRRLGKSTPSLLSELDENFVYSGTENNLLFQNLYVIEQGCRFLLANYPFDTQKCRIEVTKIMLTF